MEILIKIIFFSFILSSHNVQAQTNPCPPQFCGTNNIPIHFPFTLQGQQQPQNCGGYPGFSLTCSGEIEGRGAPVLILPYSGNFSVRYISYLIKEIQLYDPDGCLPRKLMALNLTSSPFEAMYMDEFVFLSCPRAVVAGTGFTTVDCLGNSTSAVMATTSGTLVGAILSMCTTMFTLPIPVSWNSGGRGGGDWLSSNLGGDLRLTWSFPDCKGCEDRGGVCGYDRNSTVGGGVTCKNDKAIGKRGLQLFTTILTISIVIPIILCFALIEARRAARNREAMARHMAAMESRSPPEMVGLDESTIESFDKIVIGGSKRITGPNDIKCSICLADYCPKDVLRRLPECEHCFHTECIDEWLRRNVSCPLCRNSPLHSLEAVSENV